MEWHARSSMKWSTRLPAAMFLLAVAFTAVSCGDSKKSDAASGPQKTFATPEEAGEALQAAAKTADQNAVFQVLGADAKPVVSSGDAAEDKAAFDSFTAKYDKMNRWVTLADGRKVLYVGADNYPYPIPLSKDSSSRWRFDGAAGQDEILARRIGKNELLAIDAVQAMANAQELYFKKPHDGKPANQYAQLILSSSGKQNGLYWQVPEGQEESPLGRVEEFASDAVASAAQGGPPMFDGYYFRVLTAQGSDAKGGAKSYVVNGRMSGGFALIAYPAKYQDSGIMSFILSREGVVYENDLDATTANAAAAIKEYNPGVGWTEVE
jgi:hypothetical protein